MSDENRGGLRILPPLRQASKRDLVDAFFNAMITKFNDAPEGGVIFFSGEEIGWLLAFAQMHRNCLKDMLSAYQRFAVNDPFSKMTAELIGKVLDFDPNDKQKGVFFPREETANANNQQHSSGGGTEPRADLGVGTGSERRDSDGEPQGRVTHFTSVDGSFSEPGASTDKDRG